MLRWQAHLADKLNLQPGDIDTIIITHGDGDHIGGIRAFPNARFTLERAAWDAWTSDVGRAEMIEQFIKLFRGKMPEDALAQRVHGRGIYGSEVLPALEARVDLVDPEEEFLPGIRLIAAPGHRSDHMAVEIQSVGETLLHIVDGIRHPIQVVHPEWTSFIDSFPEQLTETNRMLFQRAAQKGALVFATHLTFLALGRVQPGVSGWVWEE